MLCALPLLLSALLASGAAMAQGTVSFKAEAVPEYLEIDGKGAALNGTIRRDGAKIQGTFKVAMAEFKTGNDMRDGHMKEKYLEVDKYPEAQFVLDPVVAQGSQPFTGRMTLHGVTKPVKGKVLFQGSKATATFQLNLTEFQIAVPTYKLLTVARVVTVVAEFPI